MESVHYLHYLSCAICTLLCLPPGWTVIGAGPHLGCLPPEWIIIGAGPRLELGLGHRLVESVNALALALALGLGLDEVRLQP